MNLRCSNPARIPRSKGPGGGVREAIAGRSGTSSCDVCGEGMHRRWREEQEIRAHVTAASWDSHRAWQALLCLGAERGVSTDTRWRGSWPATDAATQPYELQPRRINYVGWREYSTEAHVDAALKAEPTLTPGLAFTFGADHRRSPSPANEAGLVFPFWSTLTDKSPQRKRRLEKSAH